MKTREQIEARIARLQEQIGWRNEEIAKLEAKFEKGVHSFSEAERINRDIEHERAMIREAYQDMRVLAWVLGND